MRIALSLLSLAGFILAASVNAEVIYKWIDANGQPHFSDVPREGAEEVFVASPQTYTSQDRGTAGTTVSPASDTQEPAASDGDRYSTLAITSPGNEETIWNTGGTISVSLAVSPALAPGHTIRLLLDGRQKQQLGQGVNRTQLSDIFRGEHQLQAQIVTPDRTVIKTSPTVTFFYKQTTVNRNPSAARPQGAPR
jgi:hypothetical protein